MTSVSGQGHHLRFEELLAGQEEAYDHTPLV